MTVVDPGPITTTASSDPGEARNRPSLLRRLWHLPLWAHAAALAVVLIALVPVVGTGSSFSADEGAAIIQARSLARGDGWIVDHPVPTVDPGGDSYPLELSARGPGGVAPFAKHPLYAVLLAGADRVGGATAMVGLSVLGTLAAAVMAALLAGRLAGSGSSVGTGGLASPSEPSRSAALADRVGPRRALRAAGPAALSEPISTGPADRGRRPGQGLSRATLWAVGLASPLVFDGYLVIAHTLGAALAVAAVLVAVVALDGGPTPARGRLSCRFDRWRRGLALGVAPLMFAAVLLRTEALLFGVALAMVAVIVSLATNKGELAVVATSPKNKGEFPVSTVPEAPLGNPANRRRLAGALVALSSLGGAGAAVLTERAWARAIVGATPASTGGGPAENLGFVAGRVKSFLLTWLRPGYEGGPGATLLIVSTVVLVVAVFAARRRPGEPGPVRILAALGAVLAVVALVIDSTNIAPGLLVAFPLAAAGMASLGRASFESTAARLTSGTFAVFALAVIATQYTTGGSGEWGGRYFALGLPVIVPVLLAALLAVGRALPDDATRRLCAGALVVSSAATITMGLGGMRSSRAFTANLMSGIHEVGLLADSGDPADGGPILVTDEPAIPRLAWATFDRQRWLLVDPLHAAEVVASLNATGVDRYVLVTAGSDRADSLPSGSVNTIYVDPDLDRVGWRVAVVEPPA